MLLDYSPENIVYVESGIRNGLIKHLVVYDFLEFFGDLILSRTARIALENYSYYFSFSFPELTYSFDHELFREYDEDRTIHLMILKHLQA